MANAHDGYLTISHDRWSSESHTPWETGARRQMTRRVVGEAAHKQGCNGKHLGWSWAAGLETGFRSRLQGLPSERKRVGVDLFFCREK